MCFDMFVSARNLGLDKCSDNVAFKRAYGSHTLFYRRNRDNITLLIVDVCETIVIHRENSEINFGTICLKYLNGGVGSSKTFLRHYSVLKI